MWFKFGVQLVPQGNMTRVKLYSDVALDSGTDSLNSFNLVLSFLKLSYHSIIILVKL